MRAGIIIIVLLCAALLGQSCSVFRQSNTMNLSPGRVDKDRTVEGDCFANNISGEDLVIGRTRINYKSDEVNRSIGGFIKQDKSGNILFSFRSLAGIEVARAFITSDSIKVYDRLNKSLYIQSVDYLEVMYGLSHADISLIWGDFPEGLLNGIPGTDEDGIVELIKERKVAEYIIRLDKENSKLKSINGKEASGRITEIVYDDYVKENGLLYPGKSTININGGEIVVELKFSGVKREKIKNMKFVVPKDASIIVLR